MGRSGQWLSRTLNLQIVAFSRSPEEEAGAGKHRGAGWGEISLRGLAEERATPARLAVTEIIVLSSR